MIYASWIYPKWSFYDHMHACIYTVLYYDCILLSFIEYDSVGISQINQIDDQLLCIRIVLETYLNMNLVKVERIAAIL